MGQPRQTGLIRPDGTPLRAKPTAGGAAQKGPLAYLRDTKSGVIRSRAAPMIGHGKAVQQSWTRSSALAMDLLRNSGRLKGAADQVLADTVGVGLILAPDPDLSGLGYDDTEKADLVRLIGRRWKLYWENAREADTRGKMSGPEMVDVSLRWHMVYGETTGVFDFFDASTRARYGIETGTKLRLYPPHQLMQDSNDAQRLFQGVTHDENGRPTHYRFRTSVSGFAPAQDFAAFDADGRPAVLHAFEAQDSEDVRGISVMAAAFRRHIQAEQLDDAVLQTAILQTIFAIVLTSEAPSRDAFEALQVLDESTELKHEGAKKDYLGWMGASLDRAADSGLHVGTDPQVSHLAPGEKLELKTTGMPGRDYLPFSKNLARDMARAIGVTFGGLTMDYDSATYSSVRMETASLWPVVARRRARVAAPVCQSVYANWLDEEVGEGRIPFKGGYRAFRANRARITRANWHGPPKPTADDYKSARASTERLANGTSSIAIEAADLGVDADTLFEARKAEHEQYLRAGMASPYGQ